jgi:SAM-dependent methyltransferase
MNKRVDLYSAYGNFTEQVLAAVRAETFGKDIGQNSWLTVDEFDRFISWLQVGSQHHVIEVASGSGGPARYLAERTGCRVTGIDANESGIETATQGLNETNLSVTFRLADATARLPFDDGSFDGLVCIDAMNHLPNRLEVLREWCRILRPKGRAVFTDPVLITGPVTNDELALRSLVGVFLFVPPGVNEKFIIDAGLNLVRQEDVSDNAAQVSKRWHDARERHKDALVQMEGEERFEGLQKFLAAVHGLTSERRLSRIVYVVEKPARVLGI